VTPALTDVPVDLGRDDARAAVQAELTDPRYAAARPNLLSTVFNWIVEKFMDLLNAISGAVPGGFLGVLVILVVLVVLVVVVRLRVGKLGRSAGQARQVFAGRKQTADEYRAASTAAAEAGDYGQAVREHFRAIVRALEQRGLLDERSGRTADEAAAEAGKLLPDCAAGLFDGARLFDDVHYGGHPATSAGYRQLVELDDRCAVARPVALVSVR
jgi:Na+-transporting methylmalonyl-CoA/oxaloacetate decarboxylase gamma subunit